MKPAGGFSFNFSVLPVVMSFPLSFRPGSFTSFARLDLFLDR